MISKLKSAKTSERKQLQEHLASNRELVEFYTARLAELAAPLPPSDSEVNLGKAAEALEVASKAKEAARAELLAEVRDADDLDLLGITTFMPELHELGARLVVAHDKLNGPSSSARAALSALIAVRNEMRDAIVGDEDLLERAAVQLRNKAFATASSEVKIQSGLVKSLRAYVAVDGPRRVEARASALVYVKKNLVERQETVAVLKARLAGNARFNRELAATASCYAP